MASPCTAINAERLSLYATKIVNSPFTISGGLEQRLPVCHGRLMAKPSPMAGGFFWMAAILVGTVWGVAAGNPMKGILIGTGTGALMAAAIWLLDRRRRRA